MSRDYEAPALTVLGPIADLTLTGDFPCVTVHKRGTTASKTVGATDAVFHIHGVDVPVRFCSV